ncbi:MAG: tRNA (adenosine(37)-N6)-dimethylallyltransferase MiaA [Candidatus Euphemobacter frigidus]|nr:tRNA (adenosine(37)-N6)-dimethylallyltransferase MiaA [Candidatus Euphemobacter frigidus]MDP8275078.1 tRNA (adenosine(37)-N6)-dimethylallyltransferase MiaA [Candidatus Euphemobacter frigidus]
MQINHKDKFKETIVVLGPTAVGKTAVSVLLAERIGGEIISADAFQVYRGMKIATAQPGKSELSRVPHHLIDILDISEQYSAARFRELAIPLIGEIRSRAVIPLVVGGSGLYLKALVDGLFDSPPADPVFRATLREKERENGPGYLYGLLSERDPISAQRIHKNNLKRIIRALEVLELTGIPISRWQSQWGDKSSHQSPVTSHYLIFGLRREREDLYNRINRRAEEMFDHGLVEETEELLRRGLKSNRVAWQALGYKEVEGYLRGEYSRPASIRKLAADTRHFAKRQMTWWRREKRIHWIDLEADDEPEVAVEKITRLFFLEEKK